MRQKKHRTRGKKRNQFAPCRRQATVGACLFLGLAAVSVLYFGCDSNVPKPTTERLETAQTTDNVAVG